MFSPRRLLEISPIQYGMCIADIGCGYHAHVGLMAAKQMGTTGTVYTFDVQKQVVDHVQQLSRMYGLYHVKPKQLDFETDLSGSLQVIRKADRVYMVNTLSQMKNKAQALRNAASLLSPEGRLIVVDWKKIACPVGPSLSHRLEQKEILSLCTKAGLVKLKTVEVGPYHYGIVFGKS